MAVHLETQFTQTLSMTPWSGCLIIIVSYSSKKNSLTIITTEVTY